MAYDDLKAHHSSPVASREYLRILHLAATESEAGVEAALKALLGTGVPIALAALKEKVLSGQGFSPVQDIAIEDVDLGSYDDLLEDSRQEVANE
jgi:hypothetical protein